jgi:hypothetical protein
MFEIKERAAGDDPISILMIASMLKDDAPWLYELCQDAYRAARTGDPRAMQREAMRIHDLLRYSPAVEITGADPEAVFFVSQAVDDMVRRMTTRTPEAPAQRRPAVRSRTSTSGAAEVTPTKGDNEQVRAPAAS